MKKHPLSFIIILLLISWNVTGQDIETNSTLYRMIFVEGSEFTINSENHYLPDFYIGQTEVTLGLYHAVTGKPKPDSYPGDNYPFTAITPEAIDDFITQLNKLTNRKYRLPASIEWQYAFQEGKAFKQTIYSGFNTADTAGWYFENSGGNIQPVAQKHPNLLGIYDMSGNVSEICSDGFIIDNTLLWFSMGGDCLMNSEEFAGTNFNINNGSFEGLEASTFETMPAGIRLVCDADSAHTNFPATFLAISETNILIPTEGGSQRVLVSTDGRTWNISHQPDWCRAVKSEGGLMLDIICGPSSDGRERKGWLKVSTGEQELFVNITQMPQMATHLTAETSTLSFRSMDAAKIVKVDTDGGKFTVTGLPHWCTVNPHRDYFELVCSSNTGTARQTRIKIIAEPLETFIDIVQAGSATYINTDVNKLHFPASGGTQKVNVETNGDAWNVTAPWWCSIAKQNNSFTVTCKPNSDVPNSGFIKVISGGMEAEIMTIQQAPFNSPKGQKLPIGFSAGYVQKHWEYIRTNNVKKYGVWNEYNHTNGFQFGLRFEPLFKYGFGINTGLLFDIYSSTVLRTDSFNIEYYTIFTEAALHIPLHLEYRFHFTPHVGLFFYGGVSCDIGLGAGIDEWNKEDYHTEEGEPYFTDNKIYSTTDYEFYLERLNASYDLGTGLRIYNAQLNVGFSRGLINISPRNDEVIKQNKNITVTLSWMFR